MTEKTAKESVAVSPASPDFDQSAAAKSHRSRSNGNGSGNGGGYGVRDDASSLQDAAPVGEHQVSAGELLRRRRTNQIAYVYDLRAADAFERGSLAGSYNLPLERLESNLHRLPFAGEMLFYDGGEGSVLRAAALLEENGMEDFRYTESGLEALRQALRESPEEVVFDALTRPEQASAIEEVLDKKVREFLARDGGGLEVVAIEGDRVMVVYQGACGGCASSTEGTLRFIQSALTLSLNHPIELVPVDQPD